MKNNKFEIKSIDWDILFVSKFDNIKEALKEAVQSWANLTWADLYWIYFWWIFLRNF